MGTVELVQLSAKAAIKRLCVSVVFSHGFHFWRLRGMFNRGVVSAVATMVVALGTLELGLRLFSRAFPDAAIEQKYLEFRRYDPVRGWANRPGARGVEQMLETTYSVRINSHGLRGPEHDYRKPAGMRRVAVLGDSFTWGVGVEEPDLFVSLLEQRLPATEGLNFGVVGYGPVQHVLLTDKVLSVSPDVVVVAFCLGNDFADNVQWRRYGFYKPFARLDHGGELILDGYPIPENQRYPSKFDSQLLREMQRRSLAFRFAEKTILDAREAILMPHQSGLAIERAIYHTPEAPNVEVAVRVNSALMRKIVLDYSRRDVPVIVLVVPTKCEFGACYPGLATRNDAARHALERSLVGLPVKIVDPTPQFTIDDFWREDAHWRASGHRKAASELAPVVAAALEGKQSFQWDSPSAGKRGD